MPLGMGIATFDGWDVDVALDLLKRNSGIGWDPGRFAVLLRGGDVRRLGSPAGAPSPRLTPGNAWDVALDLMKHVQFVQLVHNVKQVPSYHPPGN